MTPKYSEGLAQAGTMKGGGSIYQDALKSFFCVTLYRIVVTPPLNWGTSQSLIIFNVVFCPILPPFHSYYLIPFIIWRRSFRYRRQHIICARRNSWHWSGVVDICVLRVCGVWRRHRPQRELILQSSLYPFQQPLFFLISHQARSEKPRARHQ